MRAWRWPIAVAATALAVLMTANAAFAEPKVVVTIKPIHSLVTQLMDGIATPKLLVEGSASPHSFSLRPSGVRAIHAADVFVRVSEDLEPFTRKVAKSLPEKVQLVTLVDAPNLKLLDSHHDHHDEHDDHGGADEHHGDEPEADSEPQPVDAHIWLDPDNAKAIVAYLAQILSERMPENAEKVQANAKSLTAELDALTAEIAAQTEPVKDKPFIVFHDAYHYFQSRFGLTAAGSITISPQVQPSAKRLIELRDKIRSMKVACVFAEPMFQPNLVAAVTEGLDVRTGTLDPDGAMLKPGADLYVTMMRNLAGELSSCLGERS